MSCKDCAYWVRERRRRYGDGTEQVVYKAPDGKGQCARLPIDTDPDFHCALFRDGADPIKIEDIEGAPWQYFDMGPCPDCSGRGSYEQGGACYRCAGTGKVRHYADGFVGEERTRRHPKEPINDAVPAAAAMQHPRPDVLGIGA